MMQILAVFPSPDASVRRQTCACMMLSILSSKALRLRASVVYSGMQSTFLVSLPESKLHGYAHQILG